MLIFLMFISVCVYGIPQFLYWMWLELEPYLKCHYQYISVVQQWWWIQFLHTGSDLDPGTEYLTETQSNLISDCTTQMCLVHRIVVHWLDSVVCLDAVGFFKVSITIWLVTRVSFWILSVIFIAFSTDPRLTVNVCPEIVPDQFQVLACSANVLKAKVVWFTVPFSRKISPSRN